MKKSRLEKMKAKQIAQKRQLIIVMTLLLLALVACFVLKAFTAKPDATQTKQAQGEKNIHTSQKVDKPATTK